MAPDGDIEYLQVGNRVNCAGSYGTIKYVGEVAATKGLWAGVEWDDPARGKHSGIYEGIKYFDTRIPLSGTFVRPTKLCRGVTCVDAVKERYGEVKGDKTAGVDIENLARCQRKMNARFLEVVGFDKINKMQSQFGNLHMVWLREYNIISAGQPEMLKNLCPKIKDLDISKNLLNSWKNVAEIACQLKELRVLNVSENRLVIPENPQEYQSAFSALQHVVLGMMDLTWSQVIQCSIMWPNLRELQVQLNNITCFDRPPENILSKLTHLDLEGNQIQNWDEINKLGALPHLEAMNLTNAGVSSIYFPDGSTSGKTDLFPVLKDLNLCKNQIKSWVEVGQLHKLNQLIDLRFRDNPLVDGDDIDTQRQLTIVNVGTLKMLNGVIVTRDEQKGAEYDYLKDIGKKWLTTKLENSAKCIAEFHSLYPRFAELVKKHGMPLEGEMKPERTNLSSNVINVEIFNPDGRGEPKMKTLPRTLMVEKLSGFVQRLFDTGTEIPKLSYVSSKYPEAEFPFDNALKDLNFYSIEDGDKICVRW